MGVANESALEGSQTSNMTLIILFDVRLINYNSQA